MMVKRKLDSKVDESLVDHEIGKSNVIVHNLLKIRGTYLAEPDLTVGSPGSIAKEIWVTFEIL